FLKTIAVCDDERSIVQYISEAVQVRFQSRHIPVTVDGYQNPQELLGRLEGNTCYYALLLDIDMPGLNGIELCRRFRAVNKDALVVFVSNKEELVVQAFEVQPFRFVRKRRFQREIDDLIRALVQELERRTDRYLRFSNESDGTVYSVNIRKLVYVEASGKTCLLRSTEGCEEVRVQFQALYQHLAEHSFIQTHRSYLVNPYYIYRIDMDTILLDTGETIPLSRRRRDNIKDAYFRWSKGEA
ncbi:MAG: LytTR family DNA-binding domain-containing protein, partial [Clostridiales bacterium]|nr:LytTR family DNA-binding domain-containing protein [Clostridiales bacterium]